MRARFRDRSRTFRRRLRRFFSKPFQTIWKPIGKSLKIWRKKRSRSQKRLKAKLSWSWSRFGKRIRQPRWRHFIKGLPAFLVASSLLGTFIFYRGALSSRTQTYQQVAKTALSDRKFDLAHLAYERLSLDFPSNPDYRFGLAMTSFAQNEPEACEAILEEIAPPDRPGYFQAHMFLANQQMQQINRGPEHLQKAENHLLRALQGNPTSPVAALTLAQIYMLTNRGQLAERYLREVESTNPQASLLLARLYQDPKKPERSREYAIRARDKFINLVKETPDNISRRIELAECYNILGQFSEAFETLRVTGNEASSSQLQAMREKILSLWVDDPKVGMIKRLDLIEEGLRLNPNSVRLLEKLVEASRLEGEPGDKARKQLDSLKKADGPNLSTLYLVLGIDAQKRNMLEESRKYLEKGFGDNPKMPEVANNLAWLLIQGDKPDLPRALSLVDEAVKRSPKDLRIRDTRGQILARMGRWKEALADLEPCVPAFPKDPDLHKTLAEVYTKLNMPEPAKAHERLAKSLAVKP